MNDNEHDHDRDRDGGADGAVPTAPTEGALAALTALGTVLNNVDIAGVAGRSGLPMLTFKRDNNGSWLIGQKKTIVEDGSSWAINPTSYKRGYICFGPANKVIGEQMLPVSQPMPDVTTLPDKGGFEWQEQWSVNMKCTSGVDAGTEVTFKTTTVGGIQAVAGLIGAVRDRLNGGMHDGKVVPIAHLEKGSYQKMEHGRIWFPVFAIIDWMSLDGPAAAPTSPPPPAPPTSTASAAEQPRRRRVA